MRTGPVERIDVQTGTPSGFRDILPTEAVARERISDKVRECFSSHGYLPVETPLLEDKSSLERGGRVPESPFQLFDGDGSLLVMRPDLTLAIARMVSERMDDATLPLRLRYCSPVVREESRLSGQPRQFTQLGVELVGGSGVDGESEVIALLAEALTALDVPDWRIVCGSVTPLTALLDSCAPNDEEFRANVLRLVHESDLVGLDEYVSSSDVDKTAAHALMRLPRLAGGEKVIDELDDLLDEAGVEPDLRGTTELRALVAQLSRLAGEDRLYFDFSIMNSFDYYTGVIFKGYAEGITAAIASGGRYDAVLESFGLSSVAACGFMLSLERLQEILGEQGESGVVAPGVRVAERPLRIAVPKGGLFKDAVRLLGAVGLPTEELANPGRRLIVNAGDVEYIIVRAQDAPVFVAHGGADCGICGSDSIIEAGVDLVQLVDLRFGGCRFVVAEPAWRMGAAERAYAWRGTVRVATKYPRITRSYYQRIGQQVDIVQLHGNIELGPIVGMTDRIVDITATGTTLAENDLVVVDEVLECTARFFSGPAAYRSNPRIRELSERMARIVAGDKE
ncbi:MAG: ATP phosphoribosyltransferase [Atopobiaceae bacterium]|nr:ATP phosphoribosyltransferase [Atopobiaceae bacterium]